MTLSKNSTSKMEETVDEASGSLYLSWPEVSYLEPTDILQCATCTANFSKAVNMIKGGKGRGGGVSRSCFTETKNTERHYENHGSRRIPHL